jgi:hypothetical protein
LTTPPTSTTLVEDQLRREAIKISRPCERDSC